MFRFLRGLWTVSGVHTLLLFPVELIYRAAIRLRKLIYEWNPPKSHMLPPIIVVGSITVGGSGKTPAVASLTEALLQRGLKVGIISRGYKGKYPKQNAMSVNRRSNAISSGDEPLFLARRTNCPVYVHPKRTLAAQTIAKEHNLDVIISDDGLQHYAMHRHLEIAVLDATGGLGNGHCLPSGPLREPIARLRQVDYVLLNRLNVGKDNRKLAKILSGKKTYAMTLQKTYLRRAGGGETKTTKTNQTTPATKMKTIQQWKKLYAGKKIWGVAGIAQPENFFNSLRHAGINCTTRRFPNHHRFSLQDFNFSQGAPIIITEKDAVKCEHFDIPHLWVLCRDAKIDNRLITTILGRLSRP